MSWLRHLLSQDKERKDLDAAHRTHAQAEEALAKAGEALGRAPARLELRRLDPPPQRRRKRVNGHL